MFTEAFITSEDKEEKNEINTYEPSGNKFSLDVDEEVT